MRANHQVSKTPIATWSNQSEHNTGCWTEREPIDGSDKELKELPEFAHPIMSGYSRGALYAGAWIDRICL